jgi:hypothetical protein
VIEDESPRSGGKVGHNDEHRGAVVVTTTAEAVVGRDDDAVAAFVEFVLGEEGRALVAEFGFGLP